MKNVETGLTVNAKVGASLVAEAVEANRKSLQDKVVGTVAQLLKQVEVQRRALSILERMVSACEKGLFTLSLNGQIEFMDEELNKDATWISPCAQCGYPKIVIAPPRGAR